MYCTLLEKSTPRDPRQKLGKLIYDKQIISEPRQIEACRGLSLGPACGYKRLLVIGKWCGIAYRYFCTYFTSV